MANSHNQAEASRRDLLKTVASSGLVLGCASTVAAQEESPNEIAINSPYTSCSSWQFSSPLCLTSEMNTVTTNAANQVCWSEKECRSDGRYTRECCYNPPMLDIDHYSTTEVFVGIKYDINISTLLSQASGWYAVDPPNSTAYFGVELTVHSGTTFVEKDTGDPGYWLDDFSTHASIGNEPANLHSYVNTNDQNDWVGATDQLDRYRSYDVSDMVGSTATWLLGEVPYLGTAISTGEYLGSMHNMLTNDPETGTSVEFSYSPDSVARFSPWVRVALDQMDRAQTVSVDVTEGGSPGT